jgi:hypothetical protein
VVKVPCDEKTFKKTETRLGGATFDARGSAWLRSIQNTIKKARTGLAVLAIGGPLQSNSESGVKKNALDLSFNASKKTMCCNGFVTEKIGARAKISFYASAEQRFFYGIPYVGELGVRARERVGYDQLHLLNLECSGYCSANSVGVDVSGEVYGNLLSGVGDVSGGVKGISSASITSCTQDPYFSARVQLAKLVVFAQFSAAWGLYSQSWESPVLTDYLPLILYEYPAVQ